MHDPERLSQFPFLAELSTAGRSRLLGATRHVTLPPYSKVIERGDEVAGAYLVEAGALRIYYISADGREGTLYWVDPGQSCILALNALFSRLAYPAWVETDQTETRVAVVSGDVFRELYAVEPSLQGFAFTALSARLFELMTLLQETASFGLEQRVAAFLLRRGQDHAVETTHEQIAHHLGSSREVVSRVLRNLARSSAIKLSTGSVVIVDEAKLRSLVEPC
jgi:CRP/FNR family transcriptional regulator, anaerobic regulatory protein